MLETLLAAAIDGGDEETILAALRATVNGDTIKGNTPISGQLMQIALIGNRRMRDAVFEAVSNRDVASWLAEQLLSGPTEIEYEEQEEIASRLSIAGCKRVIQSWATYGETLDGRSSSVVTMVLLGSGVEASDGILDFLSDEQFVIVTKILCGIVREEEEMPLGSVAGSGSVFNNYVMSFIAMAAASKKIPTVEAINMMPVAVLTLEGAKGSDITTWTAAQLGGSQARWELMRTAIEANPKATIADTLGGILEATAKKEPKQAAGPAL